MKGPSRTLLVCMIAVIFMACIASVKCSETPPWGVKRIRTPCVWDQDEDLAVDEGANTGDGAKVAVIDSELILIILLMEAIRATQNGTGRQT